MGFEQQLGLGDLLFERKLNPLDIQVALSEALGTPPEAIRVADRIENIQLPPQPEVFCRINFIDGGNFHTHLSPSETISAKQPTIPLVARICRRLQCRCLVSDEDVNPYTFYLVDTAGQCRHVAVDTAAADRGRYVLSEHSTR